MFGLFRRIESGTTTWRDAQAVSLWLAAMWVIGFVMGAVLVLFVFKHS